MTALVAHKTEWRPLSCQEDTALSVNNHVNIDTCSLGRRSICSKLVNVCGVGVMVKSAAVASASDILHVSDWFQSGSIYWHD